MSNLAQRHRRAVGDMESAALELLRYAERFLQNLTSTQDRVNRSREILEAARTYGTAIRRLAKLRT